MGSIQLSGITSLPGIAIALNNRGGRTARCGVAVDGGAAKAYTRSGLDWSHRFAPLLAEATTLDVGTALIDREAAAACAFGSGLGLKPLKIASFQLQYPKLPIVFR